jgi:Transposase DDE domain group 1
VTGLALAQLPRRLRRRVLIRTDSGGGTHDFLNWLAQPGRRLHYSVGMTITDDIAEAILTLPGRIWEPALDAGGQVRPGAWVADLELRHRRRARCEDRIRAAKDTGLRNLPLHGFNQNQIWCELVAMATELTTGTQMLALDGPARAWEPKRLRLRLFSAAGRLVRTGRRVRLRIAETWPWAARLTTAITRLQALAPG